MKNKRSKKTLSAIAFGLFVCAVGCYGQNMPTVVFGYVCLLAAIVQEVRDFFLT